MSTRARWRQLGELVPRFSFLAFERLIALLDDWARDDPDEAERARNHAAHALTGTFDRRFPQRTLGEFEQLTAR